MKRISFIEIELTNFKNHTSLKVALSDITNIHGRNGAGKSSLGDAVTWCLYGKDVMGSKLEPMPIGTDLESAVKLLIEVDGTQILLSRSQKKTAKYYINEVPEKATAFKELVDSLWDEKLFFSLFNPTFFSSQKWDEQRTQLLRYISEPLNKEVLDKMESLDKEALEDNLKKYTLDDLEKVHRDRYNKNDKAYERAAERSLTLEEQLKKYADSNVNEQELITRINTLKKQREALDNQDKEIIQNNHERIRLESKLNGFADQIERQKQLVNRIKEEQIQENCSKCGQPLDETSVQKVKDERQRRFNSEVENGKKLVQERNAVQTILNALPDKVQIDTREKMKIDDEIMQIRFQLDAISRVANLENEIKEARLQTEAIRKDRNESQRIVEAIKKFRTIRSEMMVNKVDNLFTKITVKLYEKLKNGEEKATFEIEMDGRPYSKLSTAEKIKAGLELIEVLSKQAEVIVPTFVDNAESILHFTSPPGQLIVARVVDEEFSIKNVSFEIGQPDGSK
ncbi:AAA family ATPase [Sutcliffiella halmapala]